ncbi:MAG: peptidylprolyl isomerase [Chitinophagaceae bacterium]
MKYISLVMMVILSAHFSIAQRMTISQMKAGIEKAANPVAYTREILKKKYKIDTVIVMSTTKFIGMADSLAYSGKKGKVYGPIEKKYLVMVLGRAPNTFNRVSQIFIDTATFRRRIADSLANSIISRVKEGKASFEDMAQAYSMGGEARTKGDLGWIARGSILPEIEKELAVRKKGEVFKVWSRTGVHVVKKTADPKEDIGFALMLRVIL